ncbi:hypothetical protein C0585_05080 [Candidatus Woesearchaeota archaeon]|nr:MAG: hypothetical protein C0585_05080 [Candidatus Woesearchaeota archaeon]
MDVMARGAGNKLADVLKRSGLAASVTDANRIARDISTTEDKVQEYFDQKKNEMYDDLANKSGNKYVEKPQAQKVPLEAPAQQSIPITHTHDGSHGDMCPHCKRTYDDNPVLDESREKEEDRPQSIKEVLEEENSGQEFIYSLVGKEKPEEQTLISKDETISETNETISETIETKSEAENKDENILQAKLEVLEEEPAKPVQEAKMEVAEDSTSSETHFQESKMEVIEEEPMDSQKYKENAITQVPNEEIPEEKKINTSDEQKIDLTSMFNFSSGKSMSQKMEMQGTQTVEEKPKVEEVKQSNGISTSAENDHPKTGNSESIDITEMFNFSKRGV